MTQLLSLQAALEIYQAHLAARNLAPRTREEYAADLTHVLDFLSTHCHLTTIQQVEAKHLEEYLADLDQAGLKGSTRRRRFSTIRSFFAYLVDNQKMAGNPATRLMPPKRDQTKPKFLTKTEYQRLLAEARFEPRDAALLELILQTGLRVSEVARLTIDDIQLPAKITKESGNAGVVKVQGKGRKYREVTLNWKACKVLKAYLAIRPEVDGSHLFITKFGKGIGPRGIQNLVAKYMEKAGIQYMTAQGPKHPGVHALRHTFGRQMVKNGAKLDVIRQALGHATLKTTSIYVELSRDDMDEDLQRHAL